jgi:hypothetical protein
MQRPRTAIAPEFMVANERAAASPSPDVAPVITITRPSSFLPSRGSQRSLRLRSAGPIRVKLPPIPHSSTASAAPATKLMERPESPPAPFGTRLVGLPAGRTARFAA